MDIRKIVTTVEDVRSEAGQPVDPPIRRVVTAAVLTNPFAGRYVEDLTEMIDDSVELSGMLSAIAVAQLDGRPVHSYGKGGIAGTKGELEHVAAFLHPKFGNPLRDACGGGKAIIPSAKKRGGPGVTARRAAPLQGRRVRAEPLRRVELRIVDAPDDDELVDRGGGDRRRPSAASRRRPASVDEIVGEDGLR